MSVQTRSKMSIGMMRQETEGEDDARKRKQGGNEQNNRHLDKEHNENEDEGGRRVMG